MACPWPRSARRRAPDGINVIAPNYHAGVIGGTSIKDQFGGAARLYDSRPSLEWSMSMVALRNLALLGIVGVAACRAGTPKPLDAGADAPVQPQDGAVDAPAVPDLAIE